MNHIPEAANLPKGMAHYWVESANNDDDQEDNENYFLFCQTADQRIFHVTKHQLIEFANAAPKDQSQLFLKPWDPIGANGKKRKRKKGKEKVKLPRKKKQKEEEEEEEEKPSVIILQAPTDQVSPVLPPEIMVMILEHMIEPTPANRKFVFSFLKGNRPNDVSDELASSKTVLRWWRKVLDQEPPGEIVDMQRFYGGRGDLKGFVRRWYSLFVRQYDTQRLIKLPEHYMPIDQQIMAEKLSRITMNTLMFHVRGRVVGTGKYWNAPWEYETLEMEIQRALDAGYEDPIVPAGYVYRPEVPLVLVYPLQKLMLKVVAKRESHNAGLWKQKFEEARWRRIRGREEDRDWIRNVWKWSETNKKVAYRIGETMRVAAYALQIMRGLEVGQRYTARDLTAYVWLCMVIIRLFYDPLEKAMHKTSMIMRFNTDLREEVRIMGLTEQEKKAESELSAKERLSKRQKRSEKYNETLWGAQYAWFAKWNPPPRKLEGGETPPLSPGTYDDDTDWVEHYQKKMDEEEEEEDEEERDERERDKRRYKRDLEYKRLLQKDEDKRRQKREGMSSSSSTSNNKFKGQQPTEFWN